VNGGFLLTVIAMSSLWPPWPFGRDREHTPEPTGTIKDLESRVIAIDTNAVVQGGEERAMDSYRLFLDLVSDDPLLRAEAMRRLGDLQLESEEAVELQRNLEALGGNLGGTIDLYQQLLETYPDYAKNDLVLYQLARAYETAGEVEPALETLDRLVGEYPNTPHASEAHFRRGEALFIEQRYMEAEEAYGRVLESGPDAPFAEQAMYKLGWALFKQLRHEEALQPFFSLLDREFQVDPAGGSGPDPAAVYTAMGRAEQELIDDTLRVLSISFSYMDGADAITDYFSERGPRSYSYIVYTNLGDLYLDQERYQDGADAYQAFVDLDPYHPKAPLVQVEVIEAYKMGGFADLVLEGKRGFVERYGPESPYWTAYTFDQQPEVVAHLKSNLTDLAAYHHSLAQENHDATEYATAARWYRSYLQSFPDDVEAPRTNFLLAEVLFESGNHHDAALEYERTAYAYPFHENSSEAGYAALLAYTEHEKSLTAAAAAEWHRQGIDSALRFVAGYPEHVEAAAVQTNAAEKLFALEDFERAREVGLAVVARQPPPSQEMRRTAWTVVAHSEFDLENYAAAENAYSTLSALVPAGDAQMDEIVERVASAIYKQGEQAKALGDANQAVDHFLRVGRAVPNSPIRATAEYDAAAVLIQAGDWPRAAAVLEDFRSRFPDHELASEVTASLAVAYVETGNSVRAASEFERIADGDASADVKKEALWRAAELYADSGQAAAAATAFTRYVERYPRPAAEAIEARQRLVVLAESGRDLRARTRWMQEIVAADAAAGGERSDRTRYLAAVSQLALAEPAREAFHSVRLVAPLQDSLKIKRARMEVALAAYGKAADYAVAEVTTAATYQIAELYHGLGRDLFDSERPAELSPEELSQYDILLEEQAFPFEEEAIELHEVNAARTATGVYDQWVVKSLEALAELMPVRYAKEEIGEHFVSAIR
jgi:TolA-binding protein